MSEVTSEVDPLIGSVVADRYRIREQIGAGAMGAVYHADQIGLSRPVALKVLKQDASWDATTVARFQREARAMSALTHPNTVRVFDFGTTDGGLLFLAMELLHGELASRRLQRGEVAPREALQLARQILLSIGEAHAKKIIHRDLKPDNVFLARVEGSDEPSVKVLDFGIAKAIEGERAIDQFETLDGTVFGTPRYMSPEQASGKTLDHRCDLYAVGIILYELLTGAPPFMDNDAVVVMAKHIRERPPPLHEAAPELSVPASFQQLMDRALHKAPELRFQSAEQFVQAIEGCERDLQRFARLPAGGKRVANAVLRTPRATMVGLSICIALLLFVVFAWMRDGPGGDAQALGNSLAMAGPLAASGDTARGTAGARVTVLASKPSGAEVWSGDQRLGRTPLPLRVSDGQSVRVELRRKGFAPHTLDVTGARSSRVVSLERVKSRRRPRVAAARAAKRKAKNRIEAKARAKAKAHAKPKTQGNKGPSKRQTAARNRAAETSEDRSPYEKFR